MIPCCYRRLSLLVGLLSLSIWPGCAHHGVLGARLDGCHYCESIVWPCFGHYSTCWRPWPEECPPCPSPYYGVYEKPQEPLPSAKEPADLEPPLPPVVPAVPR